MSFFDCPECWETPCRCGYMYRNWTKEQRRDLAIAAMKSVSSEQESSSLERQLSEARQKAIKECVTVLERREAEHLKNYRAGSDVAADYLHEIEQCTEALRALLKEKS